MESASMSAIARHMHTLLTEYSSFRGKSCRSGLRPMWDVVAITTADDAQREAFELQLEDKYSRNELPLDLPVHIVSDPPGPRIGNGGSTLVALEFLEAQYGDHLYQKKVLLIHAGGWSQRMPSATILGKIFAAIPHGNPVYQMLDLKLALYWPFVSAVSPGVFLVCADDFLVYDLGDEGDFTIPATGFTALAHPSPISIGRTRGVYVVDGVDTLDTKKHVVVADCLEVLQKPSDERMKEQGALLKSENNHFEFADEISMNGEVVYTDSCFYFGVDVVRRMLKLKKELGTIVCEIDAYGDFLQALGPCATDAYIFNMSNVSQLTSGLMEVRKHVFDVMRGSHIHLLILNASKFIHIGTTKELIFHFCQDKQFQLQMALGKDVFNAWEMQESPNGDSCISQTLNTETDSQKNDMEGTEAKGCVMHSVLTHPSTIDANSVVEYCHFEVPVVVKDNTIVSSCQWLRSESPVDEAVILPADTFFHTVTVMLEGSTLFVTVFFAILDNLKTSVPFSTMSSLPFLNKNLGSAVKQWQVPEMILASGDDASACAKVKDDVKVSLWTLKLYPGATTMTQSLKLALEMVQSVQEECLLGMPLMSEGRVLFSLADLLTHKDVVTMLNFRRQLFHKIQGSRTSCVTR